MKTLKTIFGILFNVVCVALLICAIFVVYNSHKTGEPANLFGFRPVYVLSGSMEPYMKTNSVVITKEVSSIDEINVGDVITFHISDGNEEINITHRIVDITPEGIIQTKGDNNHVTDDFTLTFDNVESKVVLVLNWVAVLVFFWGTGSGKFIIISGALAIVLLLVSLGFMLKKDKK